MTNRCPRPLVGQDVRVERGELRFEVTTSKISWGAYFRDQMKPKFGGVASRTSGFEDYSGRGPSVVAENAAGEQRVVAVTKKLQEAKDKAVVIENDFKALGVAAWCERYDVPPSFVTG
jgi:predicted NBD/HSP70 family sugar kinase